jgi:4-hydroxybenzoate polyprenyltransferase
MFLAMACALLLTAFAFTFNDIQDIEYDRKSGSKSERPLITGALSVRSAWLTSIGFLTGGNLLLALWAPWAALCVGLSTIPVSIAYSWRTYPFKTLPALSSLIHLIFGTQAFILGAWSVGNADWTSLGIGAFFGLVFAAGHLHHEVADVEPDRRSGIKTHAVRFGPRPTLMAGFLLWCLSCVHFSGLALLHLVPAPWGWIQLGMFTCYLAGFMLIVRGRPDPNRLKTLQVIYRSAYLGGGVLMATATLLESI